MLFKNILEYPPSTYKWAPCLPYSMLSCSELTIQSNLSIVVRPKKNICVFTVTGKKKSRVGRSALIFFFIKLSAKPEIVVPGSGIRYFIFEISGKASFVETVLWRVTQFSYLLCSQFRQKPSGWINKTLLLIKQQKWLSEFCVKIHRVSSKN
jgi:hypothetical protein